MGKKRNEGHKYHMQAGAIKNQLCELRNNNRDTVMTRGKHNFINQNNAPYHPDTSSKLRISLQHAADVSPEHFNTNQRILLK
jgi:hypothetical protein